MNKDNRFNRIYLDIRSKILTDEFRPGQKLSEIQFARKYDCSRTPIRDILKRLENDGLVIIKQKSGSYVKNETKKEFIDLMQVRASLEQLAFNLAIENLSDRDLQKMEKTNKQMDNLVNSDPIDMMKFAQVHYQFHQQFVHLSGNDLLILLFERLNLRSSHMFYQIMDHRLGLTTQEEHQKILDHLKERDPEGAAFIYDHLFRKIKRYLGMSI